MAALPQEEELSMTGTIKKIIRQKGYGFITLTTAATRFLSP
jgi:hypothetical protein